MRLTSTLLLVVTLVFSGSCIAEDRTIFEGFRGRIGTKVDPITDRKTNFLAIEMYYTTLNIFSHDNLFIVGSDKLPVTNSALNVIRIEKSKPIQLHKVAGQNALTVRSKDDAAKIISAFVQGKEIIYRVDSLMQSEPMDLRLTSEAAGFLYSKAATSFGWKSLGQKAELPAAKIEQRRYPGLYSSAKVACCLVDGTLEFEQREKNSYDSDGKTIFLMFDGSKIVGFDGIDWVFDTFWSDNILGRTPKIVVYDKTGKAMLQVEPPRRTNGGSNRIVKWPSGETVIRAALQAGPEGKIHLENFGNGIDRSHFLYGLKELWDFGVLNFGLPSTVEVENGRTSKPIDNLKKN